MQKYSYDNYNVYIIKSNKFKTIRIHTIITNKYENKDRTYAKLLSNVLCRTTKKCKTEIDLSKEIMNLYNPGFGIYNSYLNNHTMSLKLTFLNEKYTEKGMNKKTIDFYYDILFNPNIDGEKFETTNFELSKKALKSMFNREKENPGYYAYKNATKLISEDLPIKYPNSGCLEELENITDESLYQYYKKILSNPIVNVFVTGDVDEEEILKDINNNLKGKNFIKEKCELKNYELSKCESITEKIMEEENNQSNLLMFYKFLNLTNYEREYVMDIFNRILGAPFSSKLFQNVREKNSMAYSISSYVYLKQSILIIDGGISSENYDKVVELVKEQIEEIKKGNITDKELNIATENALISYERMLDSQNGSLLNLEGEVLYNEKTDVDKIKNVSKDDIIKLANKLDLDVVFLLKGVKE